MSKQLIHGLHSIEAALLNSGREDFEIFVTDDSLKAIKNKLGKAYDWSRVKINLHSNDLLQSKAQKYFSDNDFRQQRISTNIFLLCNSLEKKDTNDLLKKIDKKEIKKIIVLDNITDVQNAAAILRTCAFYAVDAVIVSTKQEIELNPSFAKIASGAIEFVPIFYVSSLVKIIDILEERNFSCFALTEHAEEKEKINFNSNTLKAFFLGSEDKGLSHAILRKIKFKIRLVPLGKISTLNVHAAATVVMDRYFSKDLDLS